MRPYQQGFLKVGDGHRLYYERCGRRGGIPVVFVHGGPGSGFVEAHKAAFDFRKYDVLFFDQRGAGRSKPFASLKANTTSKLVGDITTLLDAFGIEEAIFYGGSWGSTLSLVYAIRNPKRVSGLMLRGIFLASAASKRHFLGGGIKAYAPEAWERFVSQVPRTERANLVEYYYRQMKSKDASIRRRFCYEWAYFELSLVSLRMKPSDIEQTLQAYSFESLAPLEAHYLRRNCFLPENYILHHAPKLSAIPVSIVHGRYDLICRPQEAFELHKRIPGSRLKIVCAGHAATDAANKRALRSELERMGKNYR